MTDVSQLCYEIAPPPNWTTITQQFLLYSMIVLYLWYHVLKNDFIMYNTFFHFSLFHSKTGLEYQNFQGSIFISQYFTFLWCPPTMLPSNWLSSGPYGTIYNIIAQCNACIFDSLLLWLMIMPKPTSKKHVRKKIPYILSEPFYCLP